MQILMEYRNGRSVRELATAVWFAYSRSECCIRYRSRVRGYCCSSQLWPILLIKQFAPFIIEWVNAIDTTCTLIQR